MAIKVFNLRCAESHQFEGWFGSEDDYASQVERGLLECPMCGSKSVHRAPSAPYLVRTAAPAEARQAAVVKPGPEQIAQFVRLAREMVAASEDVGDRFADEARRIHYREAPERSIRGVATHDEAVALEEEGIAVVPLPFAGLVKEPLQ